MNAPMSYRWDGDAMVPLRTKAANATFVVGQIYWLEEAPLERSWSAHRHLFAWLKEAWLQLPERLADELPTPEALRKRALIEAGYFDEKIIDCSTQAAALRVAAYVRGADGFAHVVTRGPLVAVRTAKSQSRRAMNAREFAASKTAIMDTIAAMIGVKPEEIGRAA